jgi:hypothetical protein
LYPPFLSTGKRPCHRGDRQDEHEGDGVKHLARGLPPRYTLSVGDRFSSEFGCEYESK